RGGGGSRVLAFGSRRSVVDGPRSTILSRWRGSRRRGVGGRRSRRLCFLCPGRALGGIAVNLAADDGGSADLVTHAAQHGVISEVVAHRRVVEGGMGDGGGPLVVAGEAVDERQVDAVARRRADIPGDLQNRRFRCPIVAGEREGKRIIIAQTGALRSQSQAVEISCLGEVVALYQVMRDAESA